MACRGRRPKKPFKIQKSSVAPSGTQWNCLPQHSAAQIVRVVAAPACTCSPPSPVCRSPCSWEALEALETLEAHRGSHRVHRRLREGHAFVEAWCDLVSTWWCDLSHRPAHPLHAGLAGGSGTSRRVNTHRWRHPRARTTLASPRRSAQHRRHGLTAPARAFAFATRDSAQCGTINSGPAMAAQASSRARRSVRYARICPSLCGLRGREIAGTPAESTDAPTNHAAAAGGRGAERRRLSLRGRHAEG